MPDPWSLTRILTASRSWRISTATAPPAGVCCTAFCRTFSTSRRSKSSSPRNGISTGSPEIPFRGDEDLLRRLVLNVLQNAVQHTPAGGAVAVDIRQDRDAVRIRVSDQGSGIPPNDQARIFDRFVQLDGA